MDFDDDWKTLGREPPCSKCKDSGYVFENGRDLPCLCSVGETIVFCLMGHNYQGAELRKLLAENPTLTLTMPIEWCSTELADFLPNSLGGPIDDIEFRALAQIIRNVASFAPLVVSLMGLGLEESHASRLARLVMRANPVLARHEDGHVVERDVAPDRERERGAVDARSEISPEERLSRLQIAIDLGLQIAIDQERRHRFAANQSRVITEDDFLALATIVRAYAGSIREDIPGAFLHTGAFRHISEARMLELARRIEGLGQEVTPSDGDGPRSPRTLG